MTAYGRARMGNLVVEIHSINRKMLDLSLYLPKDLLCLDMDVRKRLSKSLERGQVTLRVTLQGEEGSTQMFSQTLSQLKILKKEWETLSQELGYDPKEEVDLSFLVRQMQTIPWVATKEDEESVGEALNEAVDTALRDLMKMKEVEGKALSSDIQSRLSLIDETLKAVELKKETPLIHFKKKITERLKEVGLIPAEVDERVAREVALLADKMDITEELVRLQTHIQQFREYLLTEERSIGRKLDFLTQEMHREINTLGSKSCDSEISLCVVKMKSELDKIREQVQNVE